MKLPTRGNRNTVLTLVALALAAAVYVARGFAAGDWSGIEWLFGALGLTKAASAFRARGEYAHHKEVVDAPLE